MTRTEMGEHQTAWRSAIARPDPSHHRSGVSISVVGDMQPCKAVDRIHMVHRPSKTKPFAPPRYFKRSQLDRPACGVSNLDPETDLAGMAAAIMIIFGSVEADAGLMGHARLAIAMASTSLRSLRGAQPDMQRHLKF